MKIVDILKTPSFGAQCRNWSLIKIITDEGIEGLGEWRGGQSVDQLKQTLIGKDPTNVNKLHQDYLWRMQGMGAGVEIALWDMAEMYHMSIAPHYMASAIAGMAAVHICSTIPNFLALEHHSVNIPLWSTMLNFKDPIVDGYITVPDGPGLGVELDEEEILNHLPEGSVLWS